MEEKKKKRSILYRVTLFFIVFAAVIYLGITVYMGFNQAKIIFFGHRWQGREDTLDLHSDQTETDRIIDLTTASGVKTKMRLILQSGGPKNGDGESAALGKKIAPPTVLYFYGNWGSLGWAHPILEGIKKAGANVACIEWPGFGIAEGKPSEKATYEAADAIYDRLVNVEKIDPETIISMGHSLGTGPAAYVGSQKKVAGTILASGFTTIPDLAQYSYPYLPCRLVLRCQFPTRERIPQMTAPLLLIHSDDDPIIPYWMAERNFEAAQKAKLPVGLLEIRGAGHDIFFRQSESPRVWAAIREFIHRPSDPVAAANAKPTETDAPVEITGEMKTDAPGETRGDAAKGEPTAPTALLHPGKKAGERLVIAVSGGTLPFRWAPPGDFSMGSPEEEADRDPAEIRHRVTLTRGFWIAETETPQTFYEAIIGTNPSQFKGENLPVDSVSWTEAVDFCRKLNDAAGLKSPDTGGEAKNSSGIFRLPTEAEWEFACRAGNEDIFPLAEFAWTGEPTESGSTHPVATKKPNSWGINDMIGNLWEWNFDGWADFTADAAIDPFHPAAKETDGRIDRGGCWDSPPDQSRPAYRGVYEANRRSRFVGFRVVLVP